MPAEISYPGVYIEEVPNAVHTIEVVSTSVTAFAGWTRKGPANRAEHVRSWIEFENKFGGLDARSLIAYSVRHFFENGGYEAYIVRVKLPSKRTVLHPNETAFEKALLPENKTGGLYHLDRIKLFNLLCVPGETNEAVIVALQNFCRERRAFLIADCPAGSTYQSLHSGPGNIAGDNSVNSAMYFPWVVSPDPLQAGKPREFPPCGFVAGIYAEVDSNRGVWKAPAGIETSLTDVIGISPDKTISDSQNGVLNKKGINCIRTFPGKGTVVWGSRTLRGSDDLGSEWKYVSVRRTSLFIEESIYKGTQWAVFEPNDERLWTAIRATVTNFMLTLFRNGALQGLKPEQAFFVQCGRETMTQNDISRGICNVVVGFAPLKPAEFVIIRIQLMVGQAGI
ncbi:MAG: phage tail sheath family protein [Acidobacteria bacterium]|nr:MAG: phage tail sheath family protein [Acidobacteriota bacterium]